MESDVPPAIGDFAPGAEVASYRIERLVGRGGMATVYRAIDTRLDRVVALKVLTPELARSDSFRQRFILESRAGASLDHPHVIPVFEAGEADGVLFIAMRYVAGQDVRALIERNGRLPAGRTVEIVSQVASALDAAHGAGLVHRDVKPANMLLSEVSDGSSADYVYLSDFGLSKQSLSSASLTGTGQFLGTLDYMSPEQIGGRPLDGRTDLYALGCATFEMLAGEPPFKREANLAVMWAQVSAEPPSVRERRPELSPAVDVVIGKALAKSPDDRQASCAEFARALTAALAEGSVGTRAGMAVTGGAVTGGLVGGLASSGVGEATVSRLPSGGQVPPAHHLGMAATGPVPHAGGNSPPQSPPQGYQGYAGYPQQPVPGYGYPPGSSGQGYLPGYPPQPPPRRNKAIPILIGVLVAVILVGAGITVLHLSESGNPQANPRPTGAITATPTQSGGGTTATGRSATASPTASSTPTTRTTSANGTPQTTVRAYYQAINNGDYARAWAINTYAHRLSDYASYKQGFSGTKDVVLTIDYVTGDTVTVSFVAYQTNGTQKDFSGNYVVNNGQIVGASISQTN